MYELGLGRAYGGSGPELEYAWEEDEEGFTDEARIRDSLAACASTQGNDGWEGVGRGHVEAARVECVRTRCAVRVRGGLSWRRARVARFMADVVEGGRGRTDAEWW